MSYKNELQDVLSNISFILRDKHTGKITEEYADSCLKEILAYYKNKGLTFAE